MRSDRNFFDSRLMHFIYRYYETFIEYLNPDKDTNFRNHPTYANLINARLNSQMRSLYIDPKHVFLPKLKKYIDSLKQKPIASEDWVKMIIFLRDTALDCKMSNNGQPSLKCRVLHALANYILEEPTLKEQFEHERNRIKQELSENLLKDAYRYAYNIRLIEHTMITLAWLGDKNAIREAKDHARDTEKTYFLPESCETLFERYGFKEHKSFKEFMFDCNTEFENTLHAAPAAGTSPTP